EMFGGTRRQVLVSKSLGPPVIIMHEMFGVTLPVIEFAIRSRRQVDRGCVGPFAHVRRSIEFLWVARQFRIFAGHRVLTRVLRQTAKCCRVSLSKPKFAH